MKFASNNVRWFVLAIVLVGALALSGAWFMRGQAQAEPPEVPQGSCALGPDVIAYHTCTISEVAVYDNRIHVRCTTAPAAYSAVYFFAASSSPANIENTNRYLILLNTAYALNKPVTLGFDSATSANPGGCLTSDCRKLVGVVVKP